MSELTPCNHCTLEGIRRRHAGKEIELRPSVGWTACYVDHKLVATFLELTEECAC